MDRQLKERLVGAAVLIAVAAIMVPEIFSGSGSRGDGNHASSSSSAANESGQIKTYHIELQQHPDAAGSQESVAAQTSPLQPDTKADAAVSAAPRPIDHASVSLSQDSHSSSSSSQRSEATNAATRSVVQAQQHAPAAPVSATGWSIQLGSFEAESTAREIAAGTRPHGFSGYVVKARVSGRTWYRVRVGAFADRAAAESALGKLKRAYPQASLVAPNH